MIRLFHRIHLWVSVPFGIIITLICFSGAMLVFEPEITRAVKRDVYYVAEVKDTAISVSELMNSVKATLPDSVSITGVTIFSDRTRTYQVNLSKPRRTSLFIDQYSGKITGKYERLSFFSTMFKLHRWLLDSANPHGDGVKVGKLLVGISTLVFIIALITGIIIWLSRVRKTGLLRGLSISFVNGWPGFWKGLHVAGGMYAVVFVLAMSLTGLTWSFGWYRTAFYAVCGVEHTPRTFNHAERPRGDAEGEQQHGYRRGHVDNREKRKGMSGEGRHQSEFERWQQVYDELAANNPDAPQITIGPETATVTLGNTGNDGASDRYQFNRRTGEVTLVTSYSAAAGADKLRGWIYSIHTGNIGGIYTRILWMLGALLGAILPLTGYYIWIRHLRKRKGSDKNKRYN